MSYFLMSWIANMSATVEAGQDDESFVAQVSGWIRKLFR
jgi:hypothetical protein